MPPLYFDEDVRVDAVPLLVNAGCDVRMTQEEGRIGARDPAQLRFAAEQGLVLVTCNRRDFHALHEGWLDWSRAWGVERDHAGILALDQGHMPEVVAAAILAILADTPPFVNRMYDWSGNTNAWTSYRPPT